VLVNANTGRVDHDDVAVISLRNGFKKTIPDTGLSPTHEAVVAGGWRPVTFRNFRPRRPSSEAPKDAIQNPPVIDTRNAARLIRQQR
jgi:oxygen-independent coproporphyrinogen-3 oxidase